MQLGETVNPVDHVDAVIGRAGAIVEQMEVIGRYRFECVGADGEIKWIEEFDNLVMNGGKADMLNKYFAGSSYTAAWYLALVASTTSEGSGGGGASPFHRPARRSASR